MRPKSIHFTELDIDPRDLLSRYRNVAPPWPGDWIRYCCQLKETYTDPLPQVNAWLNSNIIGRWGAYSMPVNIITGHWNVIILFESVNEAIMFRLKGGSTVWTKKEDDS